MPSDAGKPVTLGVFRMWRQMSANHIGDLKPDPHNARKHNPRNVGQIVNAMHEVGAARSIVIDEDNVILAGNATIEAAGQAGIERLRIVDADGDEIVAVRRSGLTADQKTRLALYDNRAAELAEWNIPVLESLITDGVDLTAFWHEDELAALMQALPGDDEWGDAFGAVPDGDKSPFEQMTFTVTAEQGEQIRRALSAAKGYGAFVDTGNENSNGNALARVCEAYVG